MHVHVVVEFHREREVRDALAARPQQHLADVLRLENLLRLQRGDVLEQRVVDVPVNEARPRRLPLLLLRFGNLAVHHLKRVVRRAAPLLRLPLLRRLARQHAPGAREMHHPGFVVDPVRLDARGDDLPDRHLILEAVHVRHEHLRVDPHRRVRPHELPHRALHDLPLAQAVLGLAREERELLPRGGGLPRPANVSVRFVELHAHLSQRLVDPPLALAVEVLRVRAKIQLRELLPVLRIERALDRLSLHRLARLLELLEVVIERVGDDFKRLRVSLRVNPRRVQDVVVHDAKAARRVSKHDRTNDPELVHELRSRLQRAAVGRAHGGDHGGRLPRAQARDVVERLLLPRVRDARVDVDADLVDDVGERSREHRETLVLSERVLERRERQRRRLAAARERRDDARGVAQVPPDARRVTHLLLNAPEFFSHRRRRARERGNRVVDEVHLDRVHFLRNRARVILDDLLHSLPRGFPQKLAVHPRVRGRGDGDDVRAVFDHKLHETIHVGVAALARGGLPGERPGGAHRDVRALEEVHELTLRVEHRERRRGRAGTPHRGEDSDVDLVVVVLLGGFNLRRPRAVGNLRPQRLAALALHLRDRLAREQHRRALRQRHREVLLQSQVQRVLAKRVPRVGNLGDVFEEVRLFRLSHDVVDHLLRERYSQRDEPLVVRAQHRRELGAGELGDGLVLKALHARERVKRIDLDRPLRRRLRPHLRLAAHDDAHPRAHGRLHGQFRRGDVRQRFQDDGDVAVPGLFADVHRRGVFGHHVRDDLILRPRVSAVGIQRLRERRGRRAVHREQVAQALLPVVRVRRAVQRANVRGLRAGLFYAALRLRREKLMNLLVEPQRELRLDVVQRLLRARVLALVHERRELVQVWVIVPQHLDDASKLSQELRLSPRHARVSFIPLQNLVQDVASVHPALEDREVRVARRRARVVAPPAQQRRDAILQVLRDERDLEPFEVRHAQQIRDGRLRRLRLLLREVPALVLLDVPHAVLVLVLRLVVRPPAKEELAAERRRVSNAADAHEAIQDPLRLGGGVLLLERRHSRVELHALRPVRLSDLVVLRREHLLADDGRLERVQPGPAPGAARRRGSRRRLSSSPPFLLLIWAIERVVALVLERDAVVLLLVRLVLALFVEPFAKVAFVVAPVPLREHRLELADVSEDVERVLQLVAPHARHVRLDLLRPRAFALLTLDEVRELVLAVLVVVVHEVFFILHDGGFDFFLLGDVVVFVLLLELLVVRAAEEIALHLGHRLRLVAALLRRLLRRLVLLRFLPDALLLLLARESRHEVVLEEVVIVLVELHRLALLPPLVVLVVVVAVVVVDDDGDGAALASARDDRAVVVVAVVVVVRHRRRGRRRLGRSRGDGRPGRVVVVVVVVVVAVVVRVRALRLHRGRRVLGLLRRGGRRVLGRRRGGRGGVVVGHDGAILPPVQDLAPRAGADRARSPIDARDRTRARSSDRARRDRGSRTGCSQATTTRARVRRDSRCDDDRDAAAPTASAIAPRGGLCGVPTARNTRRAWTQYRT
eukprot:31044-Pelagococcus_subviridis.AAC.10